MVELRDEDGEPINMTEEEKPHEHNTIPTISVRVTDLNVSASLEASGFTSIEAQENLSYALAIMREIQKVEK